MICHNFNMCTININTNLFASKYDGKTFLFCYSIIFLCTSRNLEQKAMGQSLPLSSSCESKAPIAVREASVWRINCFLKLGYMRMGAFVNRDFNESKAKLHLSVQRNSISFLNNAKRGPAWVAKFGIKRR